MITDGRAPKTASVSLLPVFRDSTLCGAEVGASELPSLPLAKSAVARILFGSHGNDAMTRFDKAVTIHTLESDLLDKKRVQRRVPG